MGRHNLLDVSGIFFPLVPIVISIGQEEEAELGVEARERSRGRPCFEAGLV